MALLTDDCDLNNNSLRMELGGNVDYYIQIWWIDEEGLNQFKSVRISTSGGHSKTNVKCAVAELYRAMESENMNEYPQ